MAATLLERPQLSEFAPHAKLYVDQIPEGDLFTLLEQQVEKTKSLLQGLDDTWAGEFRYAPDKWTVKEIVGHLSDTERILSCRALRIARGDSTPLPGFDQDPYVETAHANDLKLNELLSEFRMVRQATCSLFHGFPNEAWLRRGTVSGHSVSVRGLAFTLMGHEIHHRNILKQKYLK